MKFFDRQLEHLISLIVLVFAVYWASRAEDFLSGSLYGLDTAFWFWLAIAIPIAHQVFVWITWRAELQYSTITRTFGDRGFIYYSVIFMTPHRYRLSCRLKSGEFANRPESPEHYCPGTARSDPLFVLQFGEVFWPEASFGDRSFRPRLP